MTSRSWPTRPLANGRLNSIRALSSPLTSNSSTPRHWRPPESRVNKSLLLYPLILLVFGLGMYVAIERGSALDASRITHHASPITPPVLQPSSGVGPSASLLANLRQNFEDPDRK